MATALFISRTDLVKNSIIDGNVDTDKFIQFIKLAQQIEIRNYLGTKLYDKISTDIAGQWSNRKLSNLSKRICTTHVNLVCTSRVHTLCSLSNKKRWSI